MPKSAKSRPKVEYDVARQFDLTHVSGTVFVDTLLSAGVAGDRTVPQDSYIVGGFYRRHFYDAATYPVKFAYALCVMHGDDTPPTSIDDAWAERMYSNKRLHRLGVFIQSVPVDGDHNILFLRMRKFFLGEDESLKLYIMPFNATNNVMSISNAKYFYMKGR